MFRKFFMVLIFVFCPYVMIVNVIGDPFGLKAGYSFLWLSFMWIVGAGLRKFNIQKFRRSRKQWIILSILLICVGASSDVLIRIITTKFFGKSIASNAFLSYVSPIIIGLSIAYLLLFEGICINKGKDNHVVLFISFLAQGSFGIYLFHTHPVIMEEWIRNRYLFLAAKSGARIFLLVFRDAFILFVLALIVDLLRVFLFKIMRIEKIGTIIERIFIRNEEF